MSLERKGVLPRMGLGGLGVGLAVFLVNAAPAQAVDGVIEINQTRASAGAVTPGDTPGFPVTIDQPGSYRLTGNLIVPNENTTAIQITAESVTIDLNGFAILGSSTLAGPNGTGIGVQGTAGTIVLNGTIRGMGSTGVLLDSRSRAENLQIYFNFRGLTGSTDSLVVNVNASRNRETGIFIGSDSTVTRSIANENIQNGIRALGSCTIVGNTVTDNDGVGIVTSLGNLVLQNTVTGNGGVGMSLSEGTGYAQNIVNENNGGNTNTQIVLNQAVQLGTNICGGDTTCP